MKMLHTLRNHPEDASYIEIGEKEGMVSEDGRYVSEEEYWEKYYSHLDFNYEWKDGYLEEKPMADFQSSLMYRWFLSILECYFSTYPLGKTVNLDIGFRLAFPGGISIRKPDMAVVLNDNPAMLNLTDCNFEGIFDMCIESLSYSAAGEIKRDTVEKKKEYQGAGVREYCILDARGEETAFYRLNAKGKYVKIKPGKSGIVRSRVLPGFQFAISDLYTQPSPEQLSADKIYGHYVLPFYQKARQQAKSEKKRAEQAEMKAQSEKMRAESEKHRAEDAEKRFLETARNMLKNGLDIALIIKYTGLSADELAELSEKNF